MTSPICKHVQEPMCSTTIRKQDNLKTTDTQDHLLLVRVPSRKDIKETQEQNNALIINNSEDKCHDELKSDALELPQEQPLRAEMFVTAGFRRSFATVYIVSYSRFVATYHCGK
jgi:hypothetical protein